MWHKTDDMEIIGSMELMSVKTRFVFVTDAQLISKSNVLLSVAFSSTETLIKKTEKVSNNTSRKSLNL